MTVNMGAGQTIEINVEATTRIDDIKMYIQKVAGIPDSQQRLVFAGTTLEGCRTVGDYSMDRLFDKPIYLVRQSPHRVRLPFGAWGGA
eukprot:CAMPEP_0170281098 /NCGR_PEP_ID=MMETSP0116_2-20130129/40568_1 /TAXON_ID=400756 /ORGANISM="Durinskia baltica, Strain CSIRO CS-38" /LENGTH=87 /DNA_ID=CAMNT_0010532439 /DNA_START=131 /DNA_END=394 /DNA_ORIENTATION=-